MVLWDTATRLLLLAAVAGLVTLGVMVVPRWLAERRRQRAKERQIEQEIEAWLQEQRARSIRLAYDDLARRIRARKEGQA